MRLQDQISFTMLQWVKPQLDEALLAAREALEAYVDQPDNALAMQACRDRLHQVRGTLRMVELEGPAMVVEEMAALADGILAGGIATRDDAYAVLMRGLMQLPDYLERVSAGHRDVPMVLLPLLNDVRACRGEEALPKSALFYPHLETPLPADAPGTDAADAASRRAELPELRLHFQQQLLGWFRGQGVPERLRAMRATLLALAARCATLPGRRLWWIAAGALEGLEQGPLKADAGELRRLASRVDRLIRQLIDGGEASLRGSDADAVARRLLYLVAHARQASPHMAVLRQTYALDALVPANDELAQAQGSMAGYNRTLLDSVARALKEDLLRVKEALDLFLRQGDGDPAQLARYGEVLERVADTLGMLALPVAREAVLEQRRVLDELAQGLRPANEDALLDLAGALLGVESSLDDHIQRLGTEGEEATDHGRLSRADGQSLVAALMHEALANTLKVRQAIVAFVESGWQHARLLGAPELMDEVAGALAMVQAPRMAELVRGIGRFVSNELLADRRIPGAGQMDQLADAMAAVEYCLEAFRDHRGSLDATLAVAEDRLRGLGYLPVPDLRASAHAPLLAVGAEPSTPELTETVSVVPGSDAGSLLATPAAPAPASAPEPEESLHLAETEATAAQPPVEDGAGDWIEVEEDVLEDVPAQDALAADVRFNAATEGIDDDIRTIFLEEMQDEIDNLRRSQAAWLEDLSRQDPLADVRRSFHTLKGSGRLVGAEVVGEFAWKVENMLNRVLDGSIAADVDVRALVAHAIDALPGMLAALKGEGAATAPISTIMRAADMLAAGQPARLEDLAPAVTERVQRRVRRRVRRDGVAAAEPAAVPGPAPAEPPVPVLPEVDPVLLEILRSEVGQYVQSLRAAIAHAGGDGLAIDEESVRAVHTLHGAIAMVDVPLLTQLLAPLESLLKRLRAAELPLPPDGVEWLAQMLDVVDEVMRQFDAASPELPNVDALAGRLGALCERYRDARAKHVAESSAADDAAPAAAVDGAAGRGMRDTRAPGSGFGPEPGSGFGPETGPEPEVGLAPEIEPGSEPGIESKFGSGIGAEPDAAPATTTTLSIAFPAGDAADVGAAALAVDAQPAPAESLSPGVAPGPGEVESGAVPPADPASASEVAADDTPAQGDAVAEPPGASAVVPGPAEGAAPAAIDPALLEIFVEEAHELLDHADDVLAAWRAQPDAAEHVDELRRDLHTLKGGARISGLPAIGDLAHAVETLLDRRAAAPSPPAGLIGVLEAAFDELNRLLQQAARGVASPYPAAMIARVVGLARSEPPPAPQDAAAPDVAEPAPSAAAAPAAELGALADAPEGAPGAGIAATDIRADAAGARSAAADGSGLASAATVAATAVPEDVPAATDVPEPASAATADAPEAASAAAEASEELASAATAAAAGAPEAAVAATAAAADVPEPAIAAPTGDAAGAPAAAPLPALLPEEEAEPAPSTEQIRVRADLLDELVGYAGEVAIYRGRLEQQVAGARHNIGDLEATVSRLRGQLRALEIETEAQIIARFQREHRENDMASFDPLELDRYSQLQQYSRALAESVSDLASLQATLDGLTRQAETLLVQQSRVGTELQEGLLRTRMLPFDTMVPNLRRTLRQAAREQLKSAQLEVEGARDEMDRSLLDRIKAPFEHMLRNAIAHGIETPAERRAAGKPAEGVVRIRVAREATEVVIRVSDDGRGLDRAAIRKRGIERGLLAPDVDPGDAELLALITQTGFSTAGRVSQLAGRGVGMDVVANEIRQLGGSLAIESEAGRGTTFILRLPFTLSVTHAILVRTGGTTFAVPMASVQAVARVAPETLRTLLSTPAATFHHGAEDFAVHDLARLLGLAPVAADEGDAPALLLTRSGDVRAAVHVDSMLGSREIVVKPVGPQVSSVPGVLGATIMGDGSVLVILDLVPLVRHRAARAQDVSPRDASAGAARPASEPHARPCVMVVDDSVTMRKVTSRVLERGGYEAVTAIDGLDALEKLAERVPNLMLLDIEMPRMDGFELATLMRADPRWRRVPIIMITSRTGGKHRQRALDLGVLRYLGKPYQEAELLVHIHEVLEQYALEASDDD